MGGSTGCHIPFPTSSKAARVTKKC
jgi:hypothetical protein